MPRIITAVFSSENYKSISGAWQWDYGEILRIQGLHLDQAVEIHFSLTDHGGESEPRIGITRDGVTDVPIPDSMLGYETEQDYSIYAFIYKRDENSGYTEQKIRISVKTRPKPEAFEKPEEAELFRKAIEAVNESYVSARASEKSAEGWAHGHKDYPERENDNAAYYAGQAKEIISRIPGQVEAGKKSIDAYVNAQVTGFDTHVAEKTESAESDIEAARIAANAAVVAQQESSIQEVKDKTSQYIAEKQTEAEQDIKNKAQEYATSVNEDIQAVNNAGATQVGKVNAAGTTQTDAVNTAGAVQKKAVEDAGQEALNNIGTGVDSTLSTEGKAADAAATGKAIDELKGDIDQLKQEGIGTGDSVSDEKIAEAVGTYIEAHPIEETDPTVPDWAKQPEKPTYTASEVVADAEGTAESKVSTHNTDADAHNDIRLLVQGLTTRLNALADSDDATLDQMSEVVAYTKSNKSLIDAITTGKVSVSDIIDNLTTNVSNKPLSAAQGVKLKALIDAIVVPTKLSELENDSGYAKNTDIPDKLPNPQKLTFAGAVVAEYDGSGAVTVTIPDGSGGSGTVRIEEESTDTTVELEPNKLYIFPEMEELTLTFAEPSDTGIVNEYHVVFQSGATATTLTLPDTVKLPSGFSVDANKVYEISILEGCLCYQSWEVS